MSQKSQVGNPRTTVRRQMLISASMLLGGGVLLAFPVRAAQLVAVDVKPLAEAYRASRLIGATVQNDKNEKIGVVDDLIVTPNDQVLFAVISVGGFLGLGRRLVAVPYSSLTVDDQGQKLVLPGATKGALSSLPEFHYA